MTLNFELPKTGIENIQKIKDLTTQKNKLEKYAGIACGVVAAIVVAKVTVSIIDSAQKAKQNKRIKKLEQRVEELEKQNKTQE